MQRLGFPSVIHPQIPSRLPFFRHSSTSSPSQSTWRHRDVARPPRLKPPRDREQDGGFWTMLVPNDNMPELPEGMGFRQWFYQRYYSTEAGFKALTKNFILYPENPPPGHDRGMKVALLWRTYEELKQAMLFFHPSPSRPPLPFDMFIDNTYWPIGHPFCTIFRIFNLPNSYGLHSIQHIRDQFPYLQDPVTNISLHRFDAKDKPYHLKHAVYALWQCRDAEDVKKATFQGPIGATEKALWRIAPLGNHRQILADILGEGNMEEMRVAQRNRVLKATNQTFQDSQMLAAFNSAAKTLMEDGLVGGDIQRLRSSKGVGVGTGRERRSNSKEVQDQFSRMLQEA
ncbi:hypothetical protein BT69DRAFT_1284302 [Atractiella rhizophila]|nr:hypothetical protein BT69DRAFT_1284302 [Atractiella rhizophila]